jgi:hypothetical protein
MVTIHNRHMWDWNLQCCQYLGLSAKLAECLQLCIADCPQN